MAGGASEEEDVVLVSRGGGGPGGVAALSEPQVLGLVGSGAEGEELAAVIFKTFFLSNALKSCHVELLLGSAKKAIADALDVGPLTS